MTLGLQHEHASVAALAAEVRRVVDTFHPRRRLWAGTLLACCVPVAFGLGYAVGAINISAESGAWWRFQLMFLLWVLTIPLLSFALHFAFERSVVARASLCGLLACIDLWVLFGLDVSLAGPAMLYAGALYAHASLLWLFVAEERALRRYAKAAEERTGSAAPTQSWSRLGVSSESSRFPSKRSPLFSSSAPPRRGMPRLLLWLGTIFVSGAGILVPLLTTCHGGALWFAPVACGGPMLSLLLHMAYPRRALERALLCVALLVFECAMIVEWGEPSFLLAIFAHASLLALFIDAERRARRR